MRLLKLGFLSLIGACMVACASQSKASDDFSVEEALTYCHSKVGKTLGELHRQPDSLVYSMMPRNIEHSDTLWHCRKATADEWCAGFWPGVLWMDYEYTHDETLRAEAERFTASLEYLSKRPAFDHDLGFLMFCSYGNGYRLTHNPAFRQVILDTADTLATLFNPAVGTILSWPRNVDALGGHNTIMDNMINLEMLFWAAKNGGNPYLYDIAVSHADCWAATMAAAAMTAVNG